MTDDDESSRAQLDFFERRTQELITDGVEARQATDTAWLESMVKELKWPEKWGDAIRVLIYGDFKPPAKDVVVSELGITVHKEKQTGTVLDNAAMCVLEASVEITERSLPAILDVVRRMNIFLGSWCVAALGAPCGWWSYITHTAGGGVISNFDQEHLQTIVHRIVRLPPKTRKKVEASLYWVREPSGTVREFHRRDVLRVYAGYWNAFECLVDAVHTLRPQVKLSKSEKQAQLDRFFSERNGRITSEDVVECHRSIVNPGFFGKAGHALQVCFESDADHYIEACFRRSDRRERLYDIRNAINHGEIDAENPLELSRISARQHELWMIVWRMFGRVLGVASPVDPNIENR